MLIKIHFDGACHNKVGQNNPMGLGIAVFIDGEYSEGWSDAIHAEGLNGELGTSNISEWRACVEAMRKACRMEKLVSPSPSFEIYSDSELITKQFNGEYDVKKDEFKKYYESAKRYAGKVGITKITWISRDFNKQADKLSKQGLKEEV